MKHLFKDISPSLALSQKEALQMQSLWSDSCRRIPSSEQEALHGLRESRESI